MELFPKSYKTLEQARVKNGPSNWQVVTFPYDPDEKQKVIYNYSKIENDTKDQREYASTFKRLEFDAQDGLLKINLYFAQVDESVEGVAGQTGIFFRHYDQENFYVLKLNQTNKKVIELHKKVKGEFSLLAEKVDIVRFNIWYQYFIVFHGNHLEVYREIGKIRALEKVFEIDDDSIQRGSVALGTNGDALNTFFDKFEVAPYDPLVGVMGAKTEQHREYGECMFPKSMAQRQQFF